MLIVDLIMLFMIEDIMCCFCELCFDVRKLVIWIVWIVIFGYGVNYRRYWLKVSLLEESQILSTTWVS